MRKASTGRPTARSRTVFAAFALGLVVLSCAGSPRALGPTLPPQLSAHAGPSWERLAAGIDYASIDLVAPPERLHVLRIDLESPRLEVVVTPGLPGRGRTRGSTVSSFTERSGCVAAVNANPFGPRLAFAGETMRIVGLEVAKGSLVSEPDSRYAALVFPRSGGARVLQQDSGMRVDEIRDAVGGFFLVLESGSVLGRAGPREPRTAAGVSANSRILYLLVADGRRRDSVGLSEAETGAVLAWLGAADGLCLDGGGSSAMCLRLQGAAPHLVNVPMHGGIPGWERVVGSCLGFRAAP